MGTEVATINKQSLVNKFASRYSIDAEKLLPILKATAFKVKDGEASNEQMAALLVVADQYGLNPFTGEIFAFPDKQHGIVPVVGVDGWSRIINDHPQSDGFEFRQSEKMITLPDAQLCPEWMEVIIYRKDRSHAIVVREYLDEVYRPLKNYSDGNKMKPGPWQTHTKRFLRHKTLIQGARIAYGFGGIYEEDEATQIIDMGRAQTIDVEPERIVEMPKAKERPKEQASASETKATTAPAQAAAEMSSAPHTPSVPASEAPQEVNQSSETQHTADPAPTTTTQSPAAEKKTETLLTLAQKNILKAKLKNAKKSMEDLVAKFGELEKLPFSKFNDVQEWIAST